MISPENLRQLEETLRLVHEEAALMSEEEINQAIDDALAEMRRERKQTRAEHIEIGEMTAVSRDPKG